MLLNYRLRLGAASHNWLRQRLLTSHPVTQVRECLFRVFVSKPLANMACETATELLRPCACYDSFMRCALRCDAELSV